jgi:hypothetical protein
LFIIIYANVCVRRVYPHKTNNSILSLYEKFRGYSRHIKVVFNGLVSHSSLNHTHHSLTVILREPWHRRSSKNSNFQNGKLFTFVDSTINDRRWFKCLIRSKWISISQMTLDLFYVDFFFPLSLPRLWTDFVVYILVN